MADRIKGPWSPEEDEQLRRLVVKYGPRNWTVISKSIPGRSGKSCRLRWCNQLSPQVEHRPFSAEEDETIARAHAQFGNKWATIARLLNGRTDNAVKKDAISALFNLSLHHENKAKVIEAGAVRYFVELMDPAAGMVEKAVAVLANLSSTKEGRVAIGEEGIPVLVEVVELGSARGKENAAAALLQLSMHSSRFCNIVIREGAIPPLVALTKSGTARAKEKAHNLLKYFKAQKQGNERRG